MGSHRSYTYQPLYIQTKRPLRRTVQLFLIEWCPVIATLGLVFAIVLMADQLAH
jgi:hypothetical protein